jgi:hypothetical protein
MDSSDEDRFTELVARAVKWRLWTLGVALAAVLGISSAVNSGLATSRKLDDAFLTKQLDDLAAAVPTVDLKSLRTLATETDSATYLALMRRLLEVGQTMFAGGHDEQDKKLRRAIDVRLQQFANHDRERNDAFLIRISLPYLSEPVSVNARLIADVWPPCLIVVLVVVVAFGYQQRAFEIVLSHSIALTKTESERAKRLALTEFIPGKLVPAKAGQREVLLYRRPFVIRPRAAMVSGLGALVVALSLSLMLIGDPAITRPPSAIINFYYSPLVLLMLAAAFVTVRSRDFYYRKASAVVGHAVRGYWAYRLANLWNSCNHRLDRESRWRLTPRRILSNGFVVTAVLSMFFVWTEPRQLADYSGFTFLTRQRELKLGSNSSRESAALQSSDRLARGEVAAQVPGTSDTGAPQTSGSPDVKLYPIAPGIFAQMRLHVYIAVSFLALCALHGITRRPTMRRLIGYLRAWLGVIVVLLGANLMLYFGILLLQVHRNEVVHGVLDMIFGALSGQTGLPMVLFQPTGAFAVFFASCFALVLIGPSPSLPLRILRVLRRSGTPRS